MNFKVAIIAMLYLANYFLQSASLLGYDEPCSMEPGLEECDPEKGLKCTEIDADTRCRCYYPEEMAYYPEFDECKVFVNGNCYTEGEPWSLNCSDPNARCRGRCVCEESSYLPSKEDVISSEVQCLPALEGLECDGVSLPCYPQRRLECLLGLCRCPKPLKQYWSWDEFAEAEIGCYTGVEIPDGCDPSSENGNGFCEARAYCGDDGVCHCRPGFSPDSKFLPRCNADFGQPCETHNDCQIASGLACHLGKCACKMEPDAIYDEFRKVCVAPAGFPCTLTDKTDEGMVVPCASGLICTPSTVNPSFGTCVL